MKYGYRAIFVTLLMVLHSSAGAAERPMSDLREVVDALVEILYDGDIDRATRHERIRSTIESRFSLQVIARGALGRAWVRFDETQREDFIRLFSELILHSYATSFEHFERPEIIWRGQENLREDRIEVRSVVRLERGDYPVTYRLLRTDGDWQVYDVIVENVSLVGNYRQQFASILQRGSPESLLRQLEERVETTRE